jgi:hypothetical protein
VSPGVVGLMGSGPRAYALAANSPARDRGRVVTDALRGMGTQDAFGASTPQGAAYDLGATEYRLLFPDPAAAVLTGLHGPSGEWRLQFDGQAARSYRVESSTDLIVWTRLGTALQKAPGSFEFVDRSGALRRYYRAIARGVPGI